VLPAASNLTCPLGSFASSMLPVLKLVPAILVLGAA
jgi:hypothetical protein